MKRFCLTAAIAIANVIAVAGDTINVNGNGNTIIIQKVIVVNRGRSNTHKMYGPTPTPSAKVIRRTKNCGETRRQHEKTVAQWNGLFAQ